MIPGQLDIYDMTGEERPVRRRGGQAGRARERQVAERLREDGWVVLKGTTYGVADLAALKALPGGELDRYCSAMLIEVKSTAGGPWERFGPRERAELAAAAEKAGAAAVLAHWPPRGQMRLYFQHEWP